MENVEEVLSSAIPNFSLLPFSQPPQRHVHAQGVYKRHTVEIQCGNCERFFDPQRYASCNSCGMDSAHLKRLQSLPRSPKKSLGKLEDLLEEVKVLLCEEKKENTEVEIVQSLPSPLLPTSANLAGSLTSDCFFPAGATLPNSYPGALVVKSTSKQTALSLGYEPHELAGVSVSSLLLKSFPKEIYTRIGETVHQKIQQLPSGMPTLFLTLRDFTSHSTGKIVELVMDHAISCDEERRPISVFVLIKKVRMIEEHEYADIRNNVLLPAILEDPII